MIFAATKKQEQRMRRCYTSI